VDQLQAFTKTFRRNQVNVPCRPRGHANHLNALIFFLSLFHFLTHGPCQLFITSTSLLVSNTTGIMERLRKFMLLPSDPAFDAPLPHDDHLKVRPI
jgi:hypothetical protein